MTIFKPTKAFQKKSTKGSFVPSRVVENYLRFQPKEDVDRFPPTQDREEVFWELRTEVSVVLSDEPTRVTIRCHPNYKNEGPWYDWVIVNFSIEDDESSFESIGPDDQNPQYEDGCVPCKVLAVAQAPTGEVRLLVHPCMFRKKLKDREMDTVLIEFWQLQYHNLQSKLPRELGKKICVRGRNPQNTTYEAPFLTWVNLENIVCRCLAIEEEPGVHEVLPRNTKGEPMNWVLLVRQRCDWAKEFTSAEIKIL